MIWKVQPFSQALTCTKVIIKWKSHQKINAKRVSLRHWATLHFDASPWESLAQPSFQRFMHEVLQGIPNVVCFIDDLLIFSRNEKEHIRHLQLVFERLSQYGLILNRDKCIFKVPEIDFLGHRISHKGVLPLVQKVEAIQNFPMPKTMRQLRTFLGMINFYRRFIPQAGAILHPWNGFFPHRRTARKVSRGQRKVLMLLSPLDTFWQMLLV